MALSPRPADKVAPHRWSVKPHVPQNFYDNMPSMTRNRRGWQFARTRAAAWPAAAARHDDP
jgi:hypothetical protein